MKKKIIYLVPVLFCFLFQGCLKDKMLKTYTILTPVYKDKSEVYANIKSNPATGIEKPGKIFMLGNYIFLNEVDKGIHVIDNSNPANPVVKAFINIPGNLDIAVKGTTLYADLYSDLVIVDIADPLHAVFKKYIPNIFPERIYTNGFMADTSRIIVDWTRKDTTVRFNDYCSRCDYILLSSYSPVRGSSAAGSAIGISGSMARFALRNDYLYTVNRNRLTSFNISNPAAPVQTASQQVGWSIETIFPFQDKLFIGSMTGMFIYDVTNPAVPVSQGQFTHMRSCDPVIADGSYAYVTLRSGNNCGDQNNQMDVINISNVLAPTLVKSYTLKNPHGLVKENKLLFVCDGSAGLKMYDASDAVNLQLKKEITSFETYDVIAFNGRLIVVAKDGLYQYQYTYPSTLTLESKLAVNRK
jgi:hypothetical protein